MLRFLVKYVKNKHAFFAEILYKSMKGLGTNNRKLIHTVVTRCEKDMGNIRVHFEVMYHKSLESFIIVRIHHICSETLPMTSNMAAICCRATRPVTTKLCFLRYAALKVKRQMAEKKRKPRRKSRRMIATKLVLPNPVCREKRHVDAMVK